MDGMLTQKEIIDLLTGSDEDDSASSEKSFETMFGEIFELDEEPEEEQKTGKKVEEIKNQEHVDLLGWYGTTENKDNKPVGMTYAPEYSDEGICPVCKKEVNLLVAFIKRNSCPHCGQPYNVDCWIS